jgi:two-component system, LuxR family, sensor kinase FixL
MPAMELVRALHDHARDIILVIDRDTGVIVEANRAAEIAYQYTRDELLARTIFELRQLDAPSAVERQMATADDDGIMFAALHRRRDGTTFPVEVSSRGETIEGRRLLLSIVRDITERVRLDAEREHLLHTTQQALATREEFLAVASHELRTPVAITDLQLQHARRAVVRGESPERLVSLLDRARSQVQRLSALVQRLLDASRVEAGIDVQHSDLDLADVARDAVDRLRVQIEASGSELNVDVPSIRGHWDPLLLEQVLVNLLTNALKYGEGKPVSLVARTEGDSARVEVTDRGIGLVAKDIERIFGKFERAVPAANYGGLGLGLFITRQIVEAHGGRIDVTSSLGQGAVFRVTLPCRSAIR